VPRDNGHRVAVEGGVGAGRRLRSLLLVLGPLVVVAAGGYLYLTGGRYVSTDDAYVRYDKVLISSDVAGRVMQQQVDENQPVRQGDLLFALDDEPYRIALARAEGVLAAARDEVRAMRAAYRQKEAMLRAGMVSADYLQREYERQKRLSAQNVSSESKVDEARRSADVAHEQMAAMQHDLAQVLANLGGDPDVPVDSHPRVLQATAARDQAALDLRHTRILAAADGIVANLDPRPGQYVTIGQAMGSLMESGSLYIEANLKETELTWVKPGDPVTVTVDTYPGREWHGTVESIAPASASEFSVLPAQNSSGNWVKVVQRLPVRIRVERRPGDPELRAGMSVEADIDTGHVRHLSDLLP
jgi:membrane fusion protein, multidrug efflux system